MEKERKLDNRKETKIITLPNTAHTACSWPLSSCTHCPCRHTRAVLKMRN